MSKIGYPEKIVIAIPEPGLEDPEESPVKTKPERLPSKPAPEKEPEKVPA